MNPIPNHTKVRTSKQFDDGQIEIETQSVHRSLSLVKQEISQNIQTNPERLAADIINCLQHITFHETTELTLQIQADPKTGAPRLITKTWTVHKEYYGRQATHQ